MQNVLIITKARDNRLIKLTRELAVYLMSKQRRGSKRGLVVYVHARWLEARLIFRRYVDRQLRRSKRFDAEGIRREHPEFFVPFPRRRSSSSSSVSQSQDQDVDDEGQLRYWTSSMCSQSPHLFDFVVTVCSPMTFLREILNKTSLAATALCCSLHGSFNTLFHPSYRSLWGHLASSQTSTSPTIGRSWIPLSITVLGSI